MQNIKTLFKDKKKRRSLIENLVYPLVALAIMLAIWAIIAAIKKNPFVIPSPDVVLKKFFTLGAGKTLWIAVAATLLRTLICFITSFVLALLFAALAGMFKPLHKVLAPMVSVLRSAPTVAVVLILYAFWDNDILAIAVGFLIAFPLMYSAFYSAISGVDKDLLDMAKLYKVSPIDRISHIYLPSIAECLFDTSKSTISLTFKVVIAAEILVNIYNSLGNEIQSAFATPDVVYLLAWTLIAIVFSFVLEGIVAICKKIWEVTRCRI